MPYMKGRRGRSAIVYIGSEKTSPHFPNEGGTLTLSLKLDVTYIPNGVSKEELIKNLASLVAVGLGQGILTLDTPAEVDTHYFEITEVK